ncbi:MAG: ACT domain-containing protein [Thermodesulfobacteriota bacterium]
MRVEQISVFLENKSGRIAEVTGVLAKAGVNIRALSMADTSDFGILRLIVDNTRKAEETLKSQNFTVGKTDVVAVEVEDKPGGLHRIMEILNRADINVEYMYAFVNPTAGNHAVMIFRFENLDAAVTILEQNGIRVIEGHRVYTL